MNTLCKFQRLLFVLLAGLTWQRNAEGGFLTLFTTMFCGGPVVHMATVLYQPYCLASLQVNGELTSCVYKFLQTNDK